MNSEVGCRCRKSYFTSLPRIIRLGLILSQLGVMISFATLKLDFSTKYEVLWGVTIAFTALGIVLSLAIYILNILKIPKKHDFERLMDFIIAISDAILGHILVGLGNACAIVFSIEGFNTGLLLVARAFSFLSWILYVISFIYQCRKMIRGDYA